MIHEIVLPEASMLNLTVMNKRHGDQFYFPVKKDQKKEDGFIHSCQLVIVVDGLCY